MSAPALALRVFHPSLDPREITAELGLPPQTAWAAGGDRRETCWQTRLAGNETGRGDLASALRDVAARFEHYRFFVDGIRDGGGRVEVVIDAPAVALDAALEETFRDLKIALVFR